MLRSSQMTLSLKFPAGTFVYKFYPTHAPRFFLNLRNRNNDPSSEFVPSMKGTRLKSPDLMISFGCAVRKGSGLAAVLTSLTGLQNAAYCVTQRETAITLSVVKGG